MSEVFLGEVAKERKETSKENKGRYPIVGLEHLIPEEITLTAWEENKENSFTKIFRKGDVLFGRRRAYLKKAVVAPFDGICSGDITVIQALPDKILPELLPFIIQNDALFDFAIGKSAGSLSPRVKWENLKNFRFELPDLKEQSKLASLLWSIDSTKKTYQNLIQKTDELVKSQFIEMFGNPNKISNSFRLEEAFEIRNDLRKPLNDAVRSKMHTGELYPYYGANGQVDSINEYLMDCTALCLAEDCGAYGAGESTSYIIKGKSWVNNHAHVLIPLDCCDIEFANTYFKILDMTKFVTGTTRLKLTQGKMKEIPFLLPPLSEQKKFATFVRQSDKSKFELEQTLSELNATYKRIIEENLG
ncbi:restriction endonuclease subunit S [Enterococcus gallinarum]|uniref:restriction endonuclease subunit S n=1 Tax=Enterococcus gallinarum TaxID=1353 RepID=UPI001F03CE03|nr:restriction endonuclease subunit S [Enterococcus gallinarum]